ncbi:hypothetical protein [Enterococcus rotai]|uniref:hypothetical protein n=1 Tax=Enterococcus rotai TaxID=118060 RepID=UPI0035C71BF4
MKKKWSLFISVAISVVFLFVLSTILSLSIGMIGNERNAKRAVEGLLIPSITITEDVEKIENDYKSGELKSEIRTPGLKIIEKIGSLEELDYSDYRTPVPIEVNNYDVVKLTDGDFIPPIISLVGTSKPMMSDIKIGKISVTKGRLMTNEEISKGEHVTLISDKFALKNEIRLDDVLVSNVIIRSKEDSNKTAETSLELKVVGFFKDHLYEDSEEKGKISSLRDKSDISNNFYVPNKLTKEVLIQQEKVSLKAFPDEYDNLTNRSGNKITGEQFLQQITDEEYYEPVYILKSESKRDAFEEKASKYLKDFKYFKLLYNKDKYDYLMEDISYIPVLFKVIFVICLVIMIVFCTAVFIKNRKEKLRFIFIWSVLIIAIYTSAFFVGHMVSNRLPYEMIYPDTRIDGIEKQHSIDHDDEENKELIEEEWDNYAYKRIDPNMISLREITRNYKMKIGSDYLLKYIVSFMIVILVSLLLSYLTIK